MKGEPLRYRRGHNSRKRLRYVVAPTGRETDCWMWQLAKNSHGYGVVGIAPGKTALAHRVYYEERFGPIPDGSELHHLCVVPGCVNPDHLVPTTRRDHLRISGRLKLTPADVIEIRRSKEPQSVLAERYGIDQSQVSRVKAGLAWRDVVDPEMPTEVEPTRLVSLAGASEEPQDQAPPDPRPSKRAA